MYQSQINIRYARSLFLLAEEKNIIDDIVQDIELILQWHEENDDIRIFLEHPVIKASKKSEILSDLFKDKINASTLSFLHLIVKNKRENHLKNICIDFIDLYKKHKNIKTAVLTTAFELTRTHQTHIKKTIEKAFSSPIELNTKVDETLIGGMIIQVDSKQLDLSVTRQIQKLRNQYLNIDFNKESKK
ncbi:MAG: ATP synthase F1 subunit delta [Bacteroidales bacterium]|jgi:F-type H+-transporting ATPase subunit delta|nr:ATP synthase F1 subunit delta [Bacteroidales bacterium]